MELDSEVISEKISAINTKDVSKEVLKKFIGQLECAPELWNNSDPSYMKKNMRFRALEKLLVIFKEIKSDATIEDVRKKVNTLRSNYRKELKKIEDSKRSGAGTDDIIYVPTSWVFYALSFLDKYEKPQASKSSIVEEDKEISVQNEPTPSTSSQSSVNSQSIFSPPEHSINRERGKKRKPEDLAKKQNELLSLACDYLTKGDGLGDRYLNLAKVWAEKLSRLTEDQILFAEKAINDVLLEAEMGQLHRYSVKINETPLHTLASTPVYHFTPTPTPSPSDNETISTCMPAEPANHFFATFE